MASPDRLLNPKTSEFEYETVAEGLWYRRGANCDGCQLPGLQGATFRSSADLEAPFEQCATCGQAIDVSQYGEKQTGRVRILFPPDHDDIERNPYLNPLDRTAESTDWKVAFVDAGTDDKGNGRRLALMFGERIRYTKSWGWLVYDGRRWLRDDRGTIERFAKKTVDEMRGMLLEPVWKFEAEKKVFAKHAQDSGSRGKLEAMIAMASSEPEIATGIEQFDQHPWLLNCRSGIVDLTTGLQRPHDPELYLTQVIQHNYDPNATCPRWTQFIDESGCGDKQWADYVHRAVGYTFTGEMSEEKFFFCHGNGANGKSKFLGAMRHVLGDYGTSLSFEALLKSRNTTPEQGFAHLPGKRMATASEASGSRSWNEEAVKGLSGRDPMRGKLLYQEPFEFRPVCKLWVSANDQPRIEDYGEAMWRRIVPIPFLAHFTDATRDDDLEGKLQAEAPGILAWAVRGAMRWYRERLRVEPDSIRDSREEYKADNDVIGRWVSEHCSLGDGKKGSSQDLYASYKQFAKDNNERELTQTAFGGFLGKWKPSNKLRNELGLASGFRLSKSRTTGGRIVWNGIATNEATSRANLDNVELLPTTPAPHDEARVVLEIIRVLSKESDRGHALEADILQAAALRGIDAGRCGKMLATLHRNNAVYAKGGAGTHAPLNL